MFSLHPVNNNAIDETNPKTQITIQLLNITHFSNNNWDTARFDPGFGDQTWPRFFAPQATEYSNDKNVPIGKSPIL